MPGTYVIATSFPDSVGNFSDTPYTIRDGGRLIDTVLVDQQTLRADYDESGTDYQVLGAYTVTSSTLAVGISSRGVDGINPTNDTIVVDKVQIHRVDTRPQPRTLTSPAGLPHTIDLRTDPLLTDESITITQPAMGTLSDPVSGFVTYTPNSLDVDSDFFTYSIAGSSAASATIDLQFVSDVPIVVDNAFDVSHGKPTTIDPRFDDVDPEGDLLTITRITQPEYGDIMLNDDGTITYTPDSDHWSVVGDHRVGFDYFVVDQDSESTFDRRPQRGHVTLHVVNHAPVLLAPEQWNVYADTGNATLFNRTPQSVAIDPDGDTLMVERLDSSLIDGRLTIANDGTLLFQANSQPTTYIGQSDSILYRITDGHAYSGVGRTFLVSRPTSDITTQGSAVYDLFTLDSTLLLPGSASPGAVPTNWSLLSAPAMSDRQTPAMETFGSITSDLNSGAVLLSHALDLDASPGSNGLFALHYNSETVAPRPVVQARLQYDGSDTMNVDMITATLTIFDDDANGIERENRSTVTYSDVAGNDIHDGVLIALQADEVINETGVYNYRLDIDVQESGGGDPIHFTTRGRVATVVRSGPKNPVFGGLGDGWAWEGVPVLHRFYDNSGGTPEEVLMEMGNGRSRMFARVEDSHGDEVYRAVDVSTRAALPYDYGILALRGDEFEYTAASGDYYKFDASLSRAVNNGSPSYDVLTNVMLVEHRDPGATDPSIPAAGYDWSYELNYTTHSNVARLASIHMIDGAMTTLNYNGNNLSNLSVVIPGGGTRTYTLSNVAGGDLTTISEDSRDRTFAYTTVDLPSSSGGGDRHLLVSDTFVDADYPVQTSVSYDVAGLVDAVTLGSGHGSVYQLDPRAAAGLGAPDDLNSANYTLPRIVTASEQLANIKAPTSQVEKFDGSSGTPIGYDIQTDYVLDDEGRLLSMERFYENGSRKTISTETWTRDGFGNIIDTTDVLGRRTEFTYDYEVDPLGKHFGSVVESFQDYVLSTSTYDTTFGRPTSVTDALGNVVVTVRVPERPELIDKTVSPTGGVEIYTYETTPGKRDLVKTVTDARGAVTTHNYDAHRRVRDVTTAGDSPLLTTSGSAQHKMKVTNTYNSFGNPDTVQQSYDPGNSTPLVRNTTNYDYDEFNRLIREAIYAGSTAPGSISSSIETNALSKAIYEYADSNLLEKVTVNSGAVTTFEYDNRGFQTESMIGLSAVYPTSGSGSHSVQSTTTNSFLSRWLGQTASDSGRGCCDRFRKHRSIFLQLLRAS